MIVLPKRERQWYADFTFLINSMGLLVSFFVKMSFTISWNDLSLIAITLLWIALIKLDFWWKGSFELKCKCTPRAMGCWNRSFIILSFGLLITLVSRKWIGPLFSYSLPWNSLDFELYWMRVVSYLLRGMQVIISWTCTWIFEYLYKSNVKRNMAIHS